LSQQFPLRLIEGVIPHCFSTLLKYLPSRVFRAFLKVVLACLRQLATSMGAIRDAIFALCLTVGRLDETTAQNVFERKFAISVCLLGRCQGDYCGVQAWRSPHNQL
jgi:hypothetical protein